MESYGNYAPPKKSNTGLIIGLIIGGLLLCCVGPMALIGGFGFFAFNKGKDLIVCSLAYNDMWQAAEDYAREHKGKLPHAATWMDDLRPYYKTAVADDKSGNKGQPFGNMPAEGAFGCTADGRPTGMAFNKDLDGKALDGIKSPRTTIVFFETEAPSLNQAEKYSARPFASSPKIFNSPRGWFIVNADGDVNAGSSHFNKGFNGRPQITPNSSGTHMNITPGTTTTTTGGE